MLLTHALLALFASQCVHNKKKTHEFIQDSWSWQPDLAAAAEHFAGEELSELSRTATQWVTLNNNALLPESGWTPNTPRTDSQSILTSRSRYFRADRFLVFTRRCNLPRDAGRGRTICMAWHMFPGLNRCYKGPAQHLSLIHI